jgi:serpin B
MICIKNLLYQIVFVVILFQTAEAAGSKSVEKDLSTSILPFTVQFTHRHGYKDFARRGSLVWSPVSLYEAMLMVSEGANGSTFKELERITHLNTRKEYRQWSQHFLNVAKRISEENTRFNISMKVANRLYADEKFQLNQEFNNDLEKYYHSPLEQVNFSEKEKSAKQINAWISNQTNNIIKDILKAKDINPLTRLMLVNALHFKGPWAKPFPLKLTTEENFTLSNGSIIQLKTMHLTSDFSYYHDEGNKTQWINLPYKGNNRYVLTLGLPHQDDKLYKSELYLQDSTVLSNIFNALDNSKNGNKRVQLSLPKFRIESSLDFVHYFKTYYNVTSAFDANKADFSLMSANGERGLFISKIIQKSVINVDEYGTEAAAASVIQLDGRSGMHIHEKTIELSFSRPFLFYLRDIRLKIPLFAGRFTAISMS